MSTSVLVHVPNCTGNIWCGKYSEQEGEGDEVMEIVRVPIRASDDM